MALGQKERRTALDLLSDAYALTSCDQFAPYVLAEIPKLIPCTFAAYGELEPSKARSRNWVAPEKVFTPEYQRTWGRLMPEHPAVQHFQRTAQSNAVRISDLVRASTFHRTAFYIEHCRPLGVEDELCLMFAGRENVINGLALHGSRLFSERDRVLLDILAPHLIQAWRNARVIEELNRELALVQHACERLKRAAVFLTGDRRIRFASGMARKWLAEYFGPWRESDHLPEVLDSWVRYRAAASHQDEILETPRAPLVVQRKERRLVVHLLTESDKALLVMKEEGREISAASLRSLGLSRRESEVLAQVAMGRTDVDIASALGISHKTVHKHLEHIYQCLEVQTRTAAAAKAFRAHQEWR